MTILFIVLLAIGVLYALFVLIGSGIGGLDIPGFDFHVDPGGGIDLGGEVHIPSMSPIAIASFVTAFGGFGLIGQWLSNSSPVWSLVAAAGGGLAVAALANFAFTYFFIKPQGSSHVTTSDMVGATAEVITPIPADSVGEIAMVAHGGRMTCPAKSLTGQPISRNTTVIVERMVSGVALVRPQ
jgi:hypothetical protein